MINANYKFNFVSNFATLSLTNRGSNDFYLYLRFLAVKENPTSPEMLRYNISPPMSILLSKVLYLSFASRAKTTSHVPIAQF
jgi:hypothetical protein